MSEAEAIPIITGCFVVKLKRVMGGGLRCGAIIVLLMMRTVGYARKYAAKPPVERNKVATSAIILLYACKFMSHLPAMISKASAFKRICSRRNFKRP